MTSGNDEEWMRCSKKWILCLQTNDLDKIVKGTYELPLSPGPAPAARTTPTQQRAYDEWCILENDFKIQSGKVIMLQKWLKSQFQYLMHENTFESVVGENEDITIVQLWNAAVARHQHHAAKSADRQLQRIKEIKVSAYTDPMQFNAALDAALAAYKRSKVACGQTIPTPREILDLTKEAYDDKDMY